MDLEAVLDAGRREEEVSDRVEYAIFPDPDFFGVSSSASKEETRQGLEQLRVACLDIVWPYVQGYIWQKESFALEIAHPVHHSESYGGYWRPGRQSAKASLFLSGASVSVGDEVAPPHLYGCTRFGDNIEDEWFITWLIYEISRQLPQVSATVRDTDGEYLLIEAAYALPKWLEPSNSDNRVFIRQGALHVVPRTVPPSGDIRRPGIPSLAQGLESIQDPKLRTEALQEAQAAVERRLGGYPQKAKQTMHTARCRLPIGAAQILRHEPQLVALAVDAFYNRDVDAMRAATRMEKFFPQMRLRRGGSGRGEGPQEELLVDVMVRFNRAMYAQLVQQTFQAPRGYPMPLPSEAAFPAAELGMKLACGFEMLHADLRKYVGGAEGQPGQGEAESSQLAIERETGVDSPGEMEKSRSEMATRRDAGGRGVSSQAGGGRAGSLGSGVAGASGALPGGDLGWERFRGSLEKSGYFRGLLEGSQQHRLLLQVAQERYRQTETFARVSAAMCSPLEAMDRLLAMPHSAGDFPSTNLSPSDDDTWLHTGEPELEKEMLERQLEIQAYEAKRREAKAKRAAGRAGEGKSSGAWEGGRGEEGQSKEARSRAEPERGEEEFDPTEVVAGMRSFIDKLSGYEGAELPQAGGGSPGSTREQIAMDMQRFLAELEKVVGMDVSTRIQGGSSDSEETPSTSDSDWDEDESAEDEGDESDEMCEDSPMEAAEMQPAPAESLANIRKSAMQRRMARLQGLFGGQGNGAGRAGAQGGAKNGAPGAPRPGVAITELDELAGQSAEVPWMEGAAPGKKVQAGGGRGLPARLAAAANARCGLLGKGKAPAMKGESGDEEMSSGEEEGGGRFMSQYAAAMDAELGGSSLGRSFERAGEGPSSKGMFEGALQEAREGAFGSHGTAGPGGLRPIDVDVNLVQSLMESFASQQGLPGPASNLLGAMGLQLPNAKPRDKQTAPQE